MSKKGEAFRIACPSCGAEVGSPCRTKRGSATPAVHSARREKVRKQAVKVWREKYPDAEKGYGMWTVRDGPWHAYVREGEDPTHWVHDDGWWIWDYSPHSPRLVPTFEVSIPQEPSRPYEFGKTRCQTLEEAKEMVLILRARLDFIRLLDDRYFARCEALERLAGHLVPVNLSEPKKEPKAVKFKFIGMTSSIDDLLDNVITSRLTIRVANALHWFCEKLEGMRGDSGIGRPLPKSSDMWPGMQPSYDWWGGLPIPRRVGDLTKWPKSKLLRIDNLGAKSVDYLEAVLNDAGYAFKEEG